MSLEINPAAASTAAQQVQGYTPPADPNVDTGGVDPRRYTKFDHSVTDAGSAHMSFGDFLDMINPLEHIPVISSVYRAVTGETINPVARVTGDILYGGVMGAASAIFGGVTAVADAGLEGQTGKDSGGLVLAALFGTGSDKDHSVQLADAANTTPTAAPISPVKMADASHSLTVPASPAASDGQRPSLQNPASQNIVVAQTASASPMLAALAVPGANPEEEADTAPNLPTSSTLAAQASAAIPSPSLPAPPPAGTTSAATSIKLASTAAAAASQPLLGGISLANVKTTNKQPYGGVMGPTFSNSNAPDLTGALSHNADAMRMGHTIYTNGARNLPPVLSSGYAGKNNGSLVPTTPPPVFTPVSSSTTKPNTLPTASTMAASLSNSADGPMPTGALQDMMLKAISQYKNAASNGGGGSSFNLTN